MIVQISDFTGENHVAGDIYTKASQELTLIEAKEKSYIYQIFGYNLGQEFIDDLTGNPSIPQASKWQTIFSPFNYDGSFPIYCVGIKNILIGLFRNEFVTGQLIINSINGNVNISSEAANREGVIGSNVIDYNRTVMEIEKLQLYVNDSDSYTDFEGVCFEGQLGL